MKFPKTITTYCKFCRKHTEQTVDMAKRKTRRTMAQGQRRFLRKLKGYTSFPKENPGDRNKPTKMVDLRFKCKICNKMNIRGKGWRAKKFELIKV